MSEPTNHWTRSVDAERAEDNGVNASDNPTLGEIVALRFDRRGLMKGLLAVSAITAAVTPVLPTPAAAQAPVAATPPGAGPAARTTPSFDFPEVTAGSDERHHVAEGYDAEILIRWGDKVLPDAPPFDPQNQTAEAQAKQFGYNNDYVGFLPMPGGADSASHGLLVINHEYTNEELMFPGLGRQDGRQGPNAANFRAMTPQIAAVEMMAHGGSVIEVRRENGNGANGSWRVVENSRFARRITAETEMAISGPAAGHERMRTSYDPEGRKVRGMLNNCAGATTPWGTWLTCEENVNGYFWGALDDAHPEARNYRRMGLPGRWYNWGQYHDRFDVVKEPREANRFGWVVEIDPFDPNSVPKKRTALGRFKHEGAGNIVNKDGRFVVYQGDDERFDYVYRFVTEARVDPANREANRDILDRGTLSVAKFEADGTMRWLPLVHGQGPLTAENGFASQADVVIETRRAADLLGATKMDRPEDIDANPKTNRVYLMLTNNSRRNAAQVDPANPRAENRFGHIIEFTPPDGDHAADTMRWEVLVRCGDPALAPVGATFNPATTKDGWFGMPDNCAVDRQGRLWISTDGNAPSKTGRADGLWAMETEGAQRGTSKHFFRCPAGAELCGPYFTPDDTTLFLAVQHPGEADDEDPNAKPATFENPATRWPDFKDGIPPRPAVLAVTKRGGGRIAG